MKLQKGMLAMFAVGDYMVYGIHGVCEVMNICTSPFDPSDARTYYALRPYHESSASVIYTPVNNEYVVMRALIDHAAADRLIDRLDEIEQINVPAEKARKEAYRTVFGEQTPESCVRIIKTVHNRRTQMQQQHKHMPDVDLDYEAKAKQCLYTELSLALQIPFSQVKTYIEHRRGWSEDTVMQDDKSGK